MLYMRQIPRWLGWNRTSYALFSLFVLLVTVVCYVWWPLLLDYAAYYDPRYPWWWQVDWLLLAIWGSMTLILMANADLRRDSWIVLVGLAGGMVIEAWGTQTELWVYYTAERPPLWIIPAWPIASLTIERLTHWAAARFPTGQSRAWRWAYGLIFVPFFALLLWFVAPTWQKSFTQVAVVFCAILIIRPGDLRQTVLTFACGAGLGYFLELWGTTRLCWTYYTLATPPLFAVLAHGMAAVAFWRVRLWLQAALGSPHIRRRLPWRA
jgi:hypothetical protein